MAGGAGTRLHPLTRVVSKHLLPVYNKPLIYYPLSTLMLAGIRDVLVVAAPDQLPSFQALLGDGAWLGIALRYAAQESPTGVADGLRVGAEFMGREPVALILGDNIFYADGLPELLARTARQRTGAAVFGYAVRDPERYGVLEFDAGGRVVGIEEKPAQPRSSYVVPGLYFYDHDVLEIARGLGPSPRGELEITDVNRAYLRAGRLDVTLLGRGTVWMDVGSYEALMQASVLVEAIEQREGQAIGSVEEVAFRMGYITAEQLARIAAGLSATPYGRYLRQLHPPPGRS